MMEDFLDKFKKISKKCNGDQDSTDKPSNDDGGLSDKITRKLISFINPHKINIKGILLLLAENGYKSEVKEIWRQRRASTPKVNQYFRRASKPKVNQYFPEAMLQRIPLYG